MGEIILSQQGFDFVITIPDGPISIDCERKGTLDLDKLVAIKSINATEPEEDIIESETTETLETNTSDSDSSSTSATIEATTEESTSN